MKSNKASYSQFSNQRGVGRQNVVYEGAQKLAWTADDQIFMQSVEADLGGMQAEITSAIVEDKFVAATFQLGQKLFVPSNNRVPSRVRHIELLVTYLILNYLLGVDRKYSTQVECATLCGSKTFDARVLARIYNEPEQVGIVEGSFVCLH